MRPAASFLNYVNYRNITAAACSFSVEGDNVLVSGLYADSGSAVARETAYRLFLYPDEHQEYLLSELIKSRQELAQICGFPTYAHR